MARCGCGGSVCNCVVQAGTGTTVTGSGSVANPYVVSADAPPCSAVRACISATSGAAYDSGTGVITADLSTDAGNQLVLGGDGGLFVPAATVDCADVRPCISATGGAAYNPATGVITADLSGDVGNQLVLGGDGGLFVPAGTVDCASVRPCISATGGAAYDPVTGVITADLSGDAGNQLVLGGDGGLFVPTVTCAQVRPCLSGVNGVTYDPVTGVISADISTDAGNQLVLGSDTGLFVPAAAALTTGCGLDGAGTLADPLVAAVGAWPYPCSVDTFGGVVACDASGVLRSEPRGQVSFHSFQEVRNYADLAVPAGFDQPGDSFVTNITNPDTCRPAFILVEREADVDFNLPAGAGAAYGHATDEMFYTRNNGATAILDAHVQTTKVFALGALLAPGASVPVTFDVTLGRGTAGATYNRIQVFIRAMILSL